MVETFEFPIPMADSGTAQALDGDLFSDSEEAFDSSTGMRAPAAGCDQVLGSANGDAKNKADLRAEIDTSAPFESVKEATSRFGGFGFWKPHQIKFTKAEDVDAEGIDVTNNIDEQATQLEDELAVKEREALGVLKELESTKIVAEELKLKLKKETAAFDASFVKNSDDRPEAESEKGENFEVDGNPVRNFNDSHATAHVKGGGGGVGGDHQNSSAPDLILMELEKAKLNLSNTAKDLSDIRATVDVYNKKIEKERISLEKTCQRLILSCSKISSLEEQLRQTRIQIQVSKDAEINDLSDTPSNPSRVVQQLSSEVEKFRKMGEVEKSEVQKATMELELTRARITTAEFSLTAAMKMKEAARASEASALAEIKALSNSEGSPEVTISFEEYSCLTSRAREAEDRSKKRVMGVMVRVDEAKASKMEMLRRVNDAEEEVIISKKALEAALSHAEGANRGKLSAEEALWKWRSVHNATRFKSPYCQEAVPVLRPTLSIGQILSRKLLLTEEFGTGLHGEDGGVMRKLSLGQIINKNGRKVHGSQKLHAKRKKLGFARLPTILTKRSKKKQPTTAFK